MHVKTLTTCIITTRRSLTSFIFLFLEVKTKIAAFHATEKTRSPPPGILSRGVKLKKMTVLPLTVMKPCH